MTTASSSAACGSCHVLPGQQHEDGCDVARCLHTGLQRIACDLGHRCNEDEPDPEYCEEMGCEPPHDCGQDVWTGEWPGDAECREYGWWVVDDPTQRSGRRECTADTPGARPDRERLLWQASWDPKAKRWLRAW